MTCFLRVAACCPSPRETVRPGGITNINRNGAGCSSTDEIKAACLPYTDGDLAIEANIFVPSNVAETTRITGDLEISGAITEFPDFATLAVVEGDFDH